MLYSTEQSLRLNQRQTVSSEQSLWLGYTQKAKLAKLKIPHWANTRVATHALSRVGTLVTVVGVGGALGDHHHNDDDGGNDADAATDDGPHGEATRLCAHRAGGHKVTSVQRTS